MEFGFTYMGVTMAKPWLSSYYFEQNSFKGEINSLKITTRGMFN